MINIIACEGQSEVALIESLIEKGHSLKVENIFMDKPIVARQIQKYIPTINLLPIDCKINILRVGDTQKEELSLSGLELREEYITVQKYCTKPELEIIVIIKENLFDKYCKNSNKIRPKQFVKRNIKEFDINDYFKKNDMYYSLKEYKSLKQHKKNEEYLIDLFND